MHLEVSFYEFISTILAVITVLTAITIPFILRASNARKSEQETSSKVRNSLLIGQATMIEKMSNMESSIKRNNKLFDDLFNHKQSCLEKRTDCVDKFLSKVEHNILHE